MASDSEVRVEEQSRGCEEQHTYVTRLGKSKTALIQALEFYVVELKKNFSRIELTLEEHSTQINNLET
uniref:Uncharacterized protein n=1 Tax=Rhizophora mucronata TaxID=61149 RepID=A0A2P2NQ51_RHIMU